MPQECGANSSLSTALHAAACSKAQQVLLHFVPHHFPLMNARRITANLPACLERPTRLLVRQENYPGESDLGVGLIIWDIYSRQPHELTGPLMRLPRRQVEKATETLAISLGMMDPEAKGKVPYRFTVSVPALLREPVQVRMIEERYRSMSAYITGLVFFALQVRAPDPKKVPHHKLVPLLREPDFIREAAFAHFAKDFGNAERKWPKDISQMIRDFLEKRRKEKPDA